MTSVEWNHEICIDDCFVAEIEVELSLEPGSDRRDEWLVESVAVLSRHLTPEQPHCLHYHYHWIKPTAQDWTGYLARELIEQAHNPETKLHQRCAEAWAEYLEEECFT